MTARRLPAGAWLVAVAAAIGSAHAQPPSGDAVIDTADVLRHVRRLSADAWRGRATPSPGLDSAAAYVAAHYARLGLTPLGDGGFLQWMPLRQVRRRVEAAWNTRGASRSLRWGSDLVVVEPPALNGRWRVVVAEGDSFPAAAAGAVVVLPAAAMPERALQRIAEARRRGAAVVLTVVPGEAVGRLARALQEQARQAPWALPLPPRAPLVGWIAESTWRAAEADARRGQLSLELRVAVDTVARGRAPNVVAVLPGRDPALRDEVVVLSAHLDHVGVGDAVAGDSIYNGADDNASGTAALLEIAEAMAALPPEERPRRSVLFLHVSGEELGLLGSQWFVAHAPIPLSRIVADLNVDMVGRNAPDTVVLVGKAFSTLGATVDSVAAARPDLRLHPIDDPWPEEQLFLRSDHVSFAQQGIPAIFFFGGFHTDYHRPSDEANRIDGDKLTRVARLIFAVARAVADGPVRPQWTSDGWDAVHRLTGTNDR